MLLAPALCLLSALLGGCGGGESALRTWSASDMAQLTERGPAAAEPWAVDPLHGTVKLFGAGNETVAFQLVLDAEADSPLQDIRVSVGPLTGPGRIEPTQVDLFRQWPVAVRDYPGWYLRTADRPAEPASFYDALIPADAPRHGMPWSLPPTGRLALWLDVRIPRDALAGTYRGVVTVSAGGGRVSRVPVELEVYDFVLPDTRPLRAVGGFDQAVLFRYFLRRDGRPFEPVWMDRQDPLVRQGLVVLRQFMTLAHEHRLDLVDRGLRPVLKRDLDGQVQLDWSDYDAIATPYLDGTAYADRVGQSVWPVPVHAGWPDPATYDGPDGEVYRQTVRAVLTETARHFAQLGFADRLVYWPVDAPAGADPYARFADLARLGRLAEVGCPILCPLPLDPPALTGWAVPQDLPELADWLAPPGELLDPSAEAGGPRAQYLVPGTPPYAPSLALFADPADARALAWLADRYALAGLWLGEVLDWQANPFRTGGQAHGGLFYPGPFVGLQEVLPSARLKRLRRGLQDAAYLDLLRRRGRPALADGLARTMARYVGLDAAGDHYLDARLDGWVRPAQSWALARRLLAEEVLATVRPEAVDGQRLMAQRIEWRRLTQAAGEPGVARCRARAADAGDGALRLHLEVDLHNPLPRPVAAVLGVGTLPESMTLIDRPSPLVVPEGGSARAVLTLELADPQPAGYGRLSVPLELALAGEAAQPAPQTLPLLRAARAPAGGITVDGDLTDWPVRSGNTAGEFRLAGRRGQRDPGLARLGTLVFVLRDERTLYVAFRCEAAGQAGPVAQPDNRVRYDHLLAIGEDLLEVILDPGADADTPADLFHLVLKANGTVRATRGIRADWPLGETAPWPADVRAAIRVADGVWFAELAIPLAAFGDAADARVWAVNFARHDRSAGESSDWAGATRGLYSPQSLGILLMP